MCTVVGKLCSFIICGISHSVAKLQMSIKNLIEYPSQVQMLIRSLDQSEVLLTTLLADACRHDDAIDFAMRHADVIVTMEMLQEKISNSLSIIAQTYVHSNK